MITICSATTEGIGGSTFRRLVRRARQTEGCQRGRENITIFTFRFIYQDSSRRWLGNADKPKAAKTTEQRTVSLMKQRTNDKFRFIRFVSSSAVVYVRAAIARHDHRRDRFLLINMQIMLFSQHFKSFLKDAQCPLSGLRIRSRANGVLLVLFFNLHYPRDRDVIVAKCI